MTFFCFIEANTTSVPHMEPLDAETLDQARREAQRLLMQHTEAQQARIFLEETEVEILSRGDPSPPDIIADNRLLAATGLARRSERRHLEAGERVADDTDTIWFPLDVVLRIEAGDRGLLAGWEDRQGAVGIVPLSRRGSSKWIVQHAGYAVAMERVEVADRLRTEPYFNAAVMSWLAQSRDDALLLATHNLEETAFDRVVRLLSSLNRYRSEGPISICQSEIGRLLGLQRTTVCAVMNRLRSADAISDARGRVTMFNPEQLLAI